MRSTGRPEPNACVCRSFSFADLAGGRTCRCSVEGKIRNYVLGHQEHRRELIILDDAGELQNDSCGGWQIISIPRRFRSLPEKFNAIAGLANGDILVVRVDDRYLPHHISTHVRAMEGRLWSKPSFVLSSYTGRLEQEDATGRFHASLAFRREIFDRIGGWPLTKRGDFDKGRTPSPRKRRRTCAGMPIC